MDRGLYQLTTIIMTQTVKFSSRDFFLWLITMVALYVSVISFIMLVFQYIDVLFPDPLERYYDPYSGPIRGAIASIFVFFPVYIALTRMLNQEIRKEHEKSQLGIRKWLISLTLFVSGLSVLIDMVVLINTFLGGEITARFLFKVLAIFAISGSVFGYYLYDLKGKWEKNRKMAERLGWAAGVVVVVTVLAGFFVIGSPNAAREIRLDHQRVNDLQNIQWQVVNYWQAKEVLPESLAALESDMLKGYVNPTDPETGALYEYTVTGDLAFDLCATFIRSSADLPPYAPEYSMPYLTKDENWDHDAGRVCFERAIDPELYPPYDTEKVVPSVTR
jgi:hypothetical protein